MKNEEAIIVKESDELVEGDFDFGGEADTGFDDVEVNVPFIRVLQKLSAVVDEGGGEPGQLYNTTTCEAVDEIVFVIAKTEMCYIEWKPDQGGFVERHDASSPVVAEALADYRKNKDGRKPFEYRTASADGGFNDLVQTRELWIVPLDEDLSPTGLANFSVTSTKHKPVREYLSRLRVNSKIPGGKKVPARPGIPLRNNLIRMTTVPQENNGKKSYNVVLAPYHDGPIYESVIGNSHPAVVAAKELAEMIGTGDKTANYASETLQGDDGEDLF